MQKKTCIAFVMFIMKTNVIELSIPQANDSLYFFKKWNSILKLLLQVHNIYMKIYIVNASQ